MPEEEGVRAEAAEEEVAADREVEAVPEAEVQHQERTRGAEARVEPQVGPAAEANRVEKQCRGEDRSVAGQQAQAQRESGDAGRMPRPVVERGVEEIADHV